MNARFARPANMKTTALKQATVVAALLVGSVAAHADVRDANGLVHIATEGPRDSVTVGQRFPVTYSLSAPDSLVFVARDALDAGSCRVVSLAWRETRAEGRIERIADVVMVPTELDSVAVPPVAFDFVSPQGDTLRAWSDGFDVSIRHIATSSKDVRPLKSQWEVPPDYVKWAAVALAAIALVAALVWWIRRRCARVVSEAPEVRLPPDVVALAELERIAGLGLVERGEFKSYYTLVAEAVRRYLGERFHVESMDRTTYELLEELSRRGNRVDGLDAFLSEADLVKFAKFRPEAATALRLMESARAIVVDTSPRVVAQAATATGTEA
jgi:Arc/MetJ-type ribon-helix-helix transcriptional regulator